MILTDEQTIFLQNSNQQYDCKLLHQRFGVALKLFGVESVSPLGDILCFSSPTVISSLTINKALVLAVELPNTDIFGGTCFLRLFSAQLGSILSSLLSKECFVDESSVFIEDKQTSISMINKVKDSIMFHIIFALETDIKELNNLELDEQPFNMFQTNAVQSFQQLTRSIFIETRRDNF